MKNLTLSPAIKQFTGFSLLAIAVVWAWQMPRWGHWIAVAILLYSWLQWRFPQLWLFSIPALIPAIDFTPWTGRFYFDTFDLFMLGIIGVALLTAKDRDAEPDKEKNHIPRDITLLFYLFAVSAILSLALHMDNIRPPGLNSFNSYHSPYNSFRILKGIIWSTFFLFMMQYRLSSTWPVKNLFLYGLLTGLLVTGLIGLREHWQYAGFLNFDVVYRIVANFYSMHVGGAHLDAFTVTTLPLVFYLAWRTPSRLVALLAGSAVLLGMYIGIATVSRAVILGIVVSILLWGAALFIRHAKINYNFRFAGGIAILAAAIGLLVLGTSSRFFQQRMDTLDKDMLIRLFHWQKTVELMDDDLPTTLFGMGPGSFPAVFKQLNTQGIRPGNYKLVGNNDNIFLELGTGETLYMAQRVDVEPFHRYQISYRAKSYGGNAHINTTLCERHLLHSRLCQWPGRMIKGDGQWHQFRYEIDSNMLAFGNKLTRAPVELALYNPNKNITVAVDDIRFIDLNTGENLIRNGDFSEKLDYWFFKTKEHLSWHIKNLWIAIFFEQGALGLTAFTLFLLLLARYYLKGLYYNSLYAVAGSASLGGFLSVALVGSLFDAPKITLFFFATQLFAVWVIEKHASDHA